MQADANGHVLPDLLRSGLDLVFCGTAPGTVSARAQAYYANAGNRFWKIVFDIGLTPHRLAPHDYAQLLDHDIGLTDLCKTASGQDADLPRAALDRAGLRAKILQYQPRLLAFTSLQGARWFFETNKVAAGLQTATIGATRIFALPSTSGLASNYWNPAPWQALAAAVRAPE